MKKVILLVVTVIFAATSVFADVKEDLSGQLTTLIHQQRPNMSVEVIKAKKSTALDGFYFTQFKILPSGQTSFVLTNGNYIVPSLIDIGNGEDLVAEAKNDMVQINVDVSKDDFYFGNPDADTKIIVFSDFECPYCQRANKLLHPLFKKHKDDIAVYYMHFPLQFHKKARFMAKLYEAGKELGYNFGNELYSIDVKGMSKQEILDHFKGKVSTLHQKKLEKLINSDKYNNKIEEGLKKGKEIGVRGTPYIIVNGTPISGYRPDKLKNTILGAIEDAKSESAEKKAVSDNTSSAK